MDYIILDECETALAAAIISNRQSAIQTGAKFIRSPVTHSFMSTPSKLNLFK